MKAQRLIALALLLAASTAAAYAGPCADEIAQTMARINAKLEAVARTVPPASAAQGPQAGMHRQPTPRSVADAEIELGGLSEAVKAGMAAIDRAREADLAGDRSACEQALAEAHRVIGD